jgi:hypothetical protein
MRRVTMIGTQMPNVVVSQAPLHLWSVWQGRTLLYERQQSRKHAAAGKSAVGLPVTRAASFSRGLAHLIRL